MHTGLSIGLSWVAPICSFLFVVFPGVSQPLFLGKRHSLIFTKSFASCTEALLSKESAGVFIEAGFYWLTICCLRSLFFGQVCRTCSSSSRTSSESWNGNSTRYLKALVSLQWGHILFNIALRFVFPTSVPPCLDVETVRACPNLSYPLCLLVVQFNPQVSLGADGCLYRVVKPKLPVLTAFAFPLLYKHWPERFFHFLGCWW